MANRLSDVIDGALRVLNSYGLESCSMRRVASELGVQPSALYHHVADKQTLLALMAERIIEDVAIDGDLEASAMRLREALISVRDGAEVVATAAAYRLGFFSLETDFAKHSDPELARTLLIYVVGHTQMTQLHRQATEIGFVQRDPGLDASFESGLAIIVR